MVSPSQYDPREKIAGPVTYESNPSVTSGTTAMCAPRSSKGGLMSKTCSVLEMLINSASSAKYRPGQILRITRMLMRGMPSGIRLGYLPPSVAKNELGRVPHAGCELPVSNEAFGTKLERCIENLRVVHARPSTRIRSSCRTSRRLSRNAPRVRK